MTARRPEGPAAGVRRPECRGEGHTAPGEDESALPGDCGGEARAAARAALRQLDTRTLLWLADGFGAVTGLPAIPGLSELELRHGARAVGVWVGVMAEAELAVRETRG